MPKDLDYTMRPAHTLDFTCFGSTTDNKRPKAARKNGKYNDSKWRTKKINTTDPKDH